VRKKKERKERKEGKRQTKAPLPSSGFGNGTVGNSGSGSICSFTGMYSGSLCTKSIQKNFVGLS
jgi:hypothetical protein